MSLVRIILFQCGQSVPSSLPWWHGKALGQFVTGLGLDEAD